MENNFLLQNFYENIIILFLKPSNCWAGLLDSNV